MAFQCKQRSMSQPKEANGYKEQASNPIQKRQIQGNRNGGKQRFRKKNLRTVEPQTNDEKAEQTRTAIREIIMQTYEDQNSEEYLQFINQVRDMGF